MSLWRFWDQAWKIPFTKENVKNSETERVKDAIKK